MDGDDNPNGTSLDDEFEDLVARHRLHERGEVLAREHDEAVMLHDRHPGLPRWSRDLLTLPEIERMFASMRRGRWGQRDELIGADR